MKDSTKNKQITKTPKPKRQNKNLAMPPALQHLSTADFSQQHRSQIIYLVQYFENKLRAQDHQFQAFQWREEETKDFSEGSFKNRI